MDKEITYLAGYIDGDGCFFASNSANRYRAKIIISSTSLDSLNYIQQKFGGNVFPVTTKVAHWKQQYHWVVNSKTSNELIQRCIPFLIEKREQALLLQQFIETNCNKFKNTLLYKMKTFEKKRIDSSTIQDIKSHTIHGNVSPLDWGYLAGFIDAECCFTINKYVPKSKPNPVYKIVLECNNSSPEIFYWLYQRFGGSLTFLERSKKNPKHRNQINWKISGKKLSTVLPNVLPHLRVKNKQCALLIKFYETTLPTGLSRKTKEHRESYAKVMEERDRMVEELHILNRKGLS